MGLLDKLLGRTPPAATTDSSAVADAVESLSVLYDDPEVKSERGLSLTGPRAEEVPRRGSPPIQEWRQDQYGGGPRRAA